MVLESNGGHFSILKGRWKLHTQRGSGGFSQPIEYQPKPREPAGELYDIEADRAETNKFYNQCPELVAELTALLNKIQSPGHSRPGY